MYKHILILQQNTHYNYLLFLHFELKKIKNDFLISVFSHTSALSGTLPIQDSDNMSLSHFVLAFFSNLMCIVISDTRKSDHFSKSRVICTTQRQK